MLKVYRPNVWVLFSTISHISVIILRSPFCKCDIILTFIYDFKIYIAYLGNILFLMKCYDSSAFSIGFYTIQCNIASLAVKSSLYAKQ